ncbi:MAG: prepilin-type N-terminal cleavage/methylation domain-containing protein [Myxococcota bacterium]
MKRRTETGFTLLEVLAAVAILGIWFGVLASVAIQGLRAEGENERRIRASLIGDRYVSDLEIGLDLGEFPDDTAEEFEEGEFVVHIETFPLIEMEISEAAEPAEESADLVAFFESDLSTLAADFYSIQISVRWSEGAAEKAVNRTTYYWDNTALMEALRKQDVQQDDEEEREGNPASGPQEDGA